jgi:amino acid adenylation domain-containing protein
MSTNRESQNSMDELSRRISSLSPAKRSLLELKLKKGTASTQAIPRRPVGEAAPLSFSQQRLWFIYHLDPESAVYNMVRAIRIHGALDVTALRQSLDAIVDRHEVLRTNIVTVDGEPAQIVRESRPVQFLTSDLRILPAAEREQEVQRLLSMEARQPFNLFSDLILRGTLIQLADDEHVLAMTTHHIASDGWSSGVLIQDLAAFYRAFSKGEPCSLPDLPIQYADFAVWQRQSLQGEILDNHLSYWSRQLKGAPSLLELPTDRPRPTLQTFRGARKSFQISRDLTEALKKLSQREGVTLFMTLVGAFKTLMFRYARQTDVVVGVPIANRTRPETEKLIGFFVNNLVLRTDLSGNPSFRDLLRRVREVAFDAYSHQDLPFEKLVEELHPERNMSHSPLFQVMFGLQNVPRQKLDLPDLEVTPFELNFETAKFDLFFSMFEEDGRLRGAMEYSTDLFDEARITRMLGHFEAMLESVVADPDQHIAELSILTKGERLQLLEEWNNTRREHLEDSCLHDLFEKQAERTPESIAVVFEGQQITYGELNRRANHTAHYLQRLGVGPEVLVGICMERSLDMVVGVLGVLKAGGAYLPLDPSYPQDRLAFMVEDARVRVLLTQKRLIKNLPDHKARMIALDSEWQTLTGESGNNPVRTVDPENLAYVIYTSGSTGMPKGVQIPHIAVVNFLRSMRERPELVERDILVAVTTLSFDIAGLEIYLPLLVGARVVLVSSDVAADGTRLLDIMDRCEATVMQATPATWRLLLESGWRGSPTLKVLCGGEPLPRDLADQLLDRAASVWNMYGPTETTIWSATHRVESGQGVVPIGRPIKNTQIYILDSHSNLVPAGVPGELCIGGLGLARGYKNRPELVAEKFIPDPFSPDPGARLYKTGDLARYLWDGSIECLGRIDHQVKIRGFRIELGEIDSVLSQHTGISQAITVDREIAGDKRLIAYVVAKGERRPSSDDMKAFLRKKLPEYMIPSGFMYLSDLPLTPNGKVDRKALPEPDGLRDEARDVLIAPRDLVELDLARIWGKVLNVASLGMRDNFFDLGGHSLLAVRLFAHIEQKFGKKLPLATLFEAPTIEQMSKLLRREDWAPSWSSLVPIQPNGSKPPFFCVHAHGGNVLNFIDLARRLGPDQPFFGLQAQGLDGSRPKHTSVEQMAAHYLKEIREVQPDGPYLLGGYCFGGKVAFEMAQQLHAQGEKVSLLALIDAFAPGYRTLLPWGLRKIAQIKFHLRNFKKLDATHRLRYVREKYQIARTRVRSLVKGSAGTKGLSRGVSPSRVLHGTARTADPSIKTYRRKLYPGKLTVFAPTESHSGYHRFESHLGWKGMATGGLEIHEIPGQVTAIIAEPYVKELAEQLGECIEKAQTMRAG